MPTRRIIITGPPGSAVRLEINDFIKHEKFFTLFIKAFRTFSFKDSPRGWKEFITAAVRMQKAEETDDKSFFAIAGIHGQPYTAWNGASGSFTQEKWGFGGYCTHGSVLFPTWHRPYLLLFEVSDASHFSIMCTHDKIDASKLFRNTRWRSRLTFYLTKRSGNKLRLIYAYLTGIGFQTLCLRIALSWTKPFRFWIMKVTR